MELNILDKTSLKGVSVWDTSVGYKTPRFLMSRELTGQFQKGDVLDANATAILIEEISGSGTHGDVKKYCDEQIKKLRGEMAQPLGFATLDATGNVPLTQLGNIDTNLYEIVTSLPAVGKSNKIYLIKDTTAPDKENVYYEWCYVDNAWEKMGEVHEDLTGYLKKTQSADDLYTDKSVLEGGTMSRSLMNDVTARNPLITNLTSNLPLVHFESANAPLFSASKNTANTGVPLFAGFDTQYTLSTTTGTQKIYATMLTTSQMAAGGYYLTSGDYFIPSTITLGGGLAKFSTTGVGLGYGMRDDKTKAITFLDWSQISFQSERVVLGINGLSWADKTKKYIPTAQNSFVHIGHPTVTDEYTHLCPIVQDTADTSKWYIPDMYLNLKDYAVRDEANTFTADNTFEGPNGVKFNTGASVAEGKSLHFDGGGSTSADITNAKAYWCDSSKTGSPEVDITADSIHFEADLQGSADLTMTDLTFNKQMDDKDWTYKYGVNGVNLHGKSKRDLITAKETTAFIGKRTDTTDYDRVCPLVNTSGNPEAYYIPGNYIKDDNYAKLDAANEFTATNTFDGAVSVGDTLDVNNKTSLNGELYVAGEFKFEQYGSVYDHINIYDDENTSVYSTEGITIHDLTKRDLLNGAGGSAYIGNPSEIADYKYVAPLEEYKREESGPTYYRVPDLYIDTDAYALLDAENKFTKANTFTDTVTVGDVDTTGAATTTITGGVVQTDTGTALKTDGLRMNCGKIVGWSDNGITKTPRIALTGNLFGTLRTRPNVVYGANDAILQLEDYHGNALQKFTPSGIALRGKTNQYLFNCGGSTSKLGGTDDTNTYTNVAPLESYTKDDSTTGWRIPADYIDVDHSKYAVLAESNTFTEENIFEKPITVGATGKTEIGDGELYVDDYVGLKSDGLKMGVGKMVGWGETTSATPRVFLTGTDTGSVRTISNVVYGSGDSMLNLDSIMNFTPSGISLAGKTNQQLYNGAGSMTKMGGADDTTTYSYVAPLETYDPGDGSTAYRVPSQYIDSEDFNDYLKKTQSADVITNDILSGGTLSKSLANVDTISAAAIKGTTTNAAPLLDVKIDDDDAWIARSAIIADEDKSLNNVTLNDDGIYVTNTTSSASGTTTNTAQFDASGLFLNSAKTCILRDGTVHLPISTGSIEFGLQDAYTGYNLKLCSLGTNTGLTILNKDTIADTMDLLNLNNQVEIKPKGITFVSGTPKHLLNMFGGSVYIGSYDDSTTYERVAPLVQDTTDTSKWYVPAQYINFDTTDFLKKTQSADDVTTTVFKDGTATAPLYDCKINTSLIKGTYNNSNPMIDVTQEGPSIDGVWLSDSTVKVSDDSTGSTYVAPNGVTTTDGSTIVSLGDGQLKGKTSTETKFITDTAGLKLRTGSAGIMWASDTNLENFDGSIYYDKTGGLNVNRFNSTSNTDVLLTLDGWKFTKSGVTFKGVDRAAKTANDLLTCKQSTVHIGKTGDTTAYTSVAPLVQDTTDTSKWYVPSEYIQSSGSGDYLKKTQSGDDITAEIITGGALGYAIVNSTYSDSVIKGTTANAAAILNVASSNGYAPWTAPIIGVYSSSDNQTNGQGIQITPISITNSGYGTSSSVTIEHDCVSIFDQNENASAEYKATGMDLCFDSSGVFAAERGLRFVDPVAGSPRTAICADISGTVSITNVESNLAGSSDDLLTLQSTDSEFSTTSTKYMTITKNGITKKDGTAKQLYTEAGGTATIGTTSDTTSYTAVAPLNSSNVVPATYLGLQSTTYGGYLSTSQGNFAVTFIHTSAYSITDAASLSTYISKITENLASGTYLYFPASGSFIHDSKTFVITHAYTWKTSGSANLLVSGVCGNSSTACWVITSGAATDISSIRFGTYNIL